MTYFIKMPGTVAGTGLPLASDLPFPQGDVSMWASARSVTLGTTSGRVASIIDLKTSASYPIISGATPAADDAVINGAAVFDCTSPPDTGGSNKGYALDASWWKAKDAIAFAVLAMAPDAQWAGLNQGRAMLTISNGSTPFTLFDFSAIDVVRLLSRRSSTAEAAATVTLPVDSSDWNALWAEIDFVAGTVKVENLLTGEAATSGGMGGTAGASGSPTSNTVLMGRNIDANSEFRGKMSDFIAWPAIPSAASKTLVKDYLLRKRRRLIV